MTSPAIEILQRLVFYGVTAGMLLLLALNWKRLGKTPTGDGFDDALELCAHCNYDVRGGLERCPECGRLTAAARRNRLADLRTRWPTETLVPRSPGVDETPVVVLTTDEGPAAELLRQHLDARGIAARAATPQPIGYAAYQQVMGSHRLTVWSEDADRARAIIAQLWPEAAELDRVDPES